MVISNRRAHATLATGLALALLAFGEPGRAQTAQRDGIGELIGRKGDAAAEPQPGTPKPGTGPGAGPGAGPAGSSQTTEPAMDPRAGEASYEQAQRLMKAVDAILQDTARNRGEAKKLPAEADFLVKPLWTETREDREKKVRELLDAALGIVTDVPVVDVQKKIEGLRKNIRELDDRIVKLREKQLVAPKDGMLPGYLSFGWVADFLGRRKAFVAYTLIAAALVPLYAVARHPWALLVVGTVLAFFGTGYFSGSGLIGSEIFPTKVRARALGFTYNGARAMSSVAPFVIGRVGQTKGLSWAFFLCAGAFLLAALCATQLPETKGKELK